MITKYSDIISLSKSRTVYNIRDEEPDAWKTFIANKQFNDLLRKAVKAALNNDPDHHKSLWIAGTYGSGKSHAGAVIKHLLCDPLPQISDYIEQEFSAPQFEILKTNLLTLRESKRLFPVSLYGQQSITHEDDLSLQIQREVKTALSKAGIDITVKTDFDTYVEHIDEQPGFYENLITQNPKLRALTPDLKMLKRRLADCDTGVMDRIREVLRENRFDVRMNSNNLLNWLIEVENKLREAHVYNGLLIVWDEFTEICTSSVGIKLLERIQEIADTFMSSSHDSYFVLISHPSALNGLNEQKRNQTIGRYHYVTYNMESVSAFKIMSRKFKIVNENAHKELANSFFEHHTDLLDRYSASSNQPEETKGDIQQLYPLHPGTADLATYYAREAGSSSRSVFEFLACDAVRAFFDNTRVYERRETLTADYLWDYVHEAFTEDSAKFGAVTEKFNSYNQRISQQGDNYSKVFKGILLLNALNNIANNPTVTPSEENISALYAGTDLEGDINRILEFFNEESIIQRLPGNIFSIQFTALPTNEIENIKRELRATEYRYTDQVANMNAVLPYELDKVFSHIARPFKQRVYGSQANENTLLNKIENGKKACQAYELFIANIVAGDIQELELLKTYIDKWNREHRLSDTILIIYDAPFESKNYDNFINLIANATCAQKHGLSAQAHTHTEDAKKMLREWSARIRMSNASYYTNGLQGVTASSRLVDTINSTLAPQIFSKGPDSLELIRSNSSLTYWKKQNAKVALDAVLLFSTKDEVIKKASGQGKHIEYLLQDSVDSNLEWKADVDPNHPLKQVCDFVDGVFKKTNKNQEFNLGEKLKPLSEAPYGLYPGYAGMGMVAFAMRKYANQIFSMNGKPRDSRNLVDDIRDVFKAWESGKKNPKLTFMFESKESSELCRYLIRVFKLSNLATYKDVSSLTDARWAVHEYSKKKQYPLWSLKYTGCKQEISDLIEKLVKICDPDGLTNQGMIKEAVKIFNSVELDLAVLLEEDEIFKKGFRAFLLKNDTVGLKEEDFDPLYAHLTKHLQGEIGRWTEQDVEIQQLRWKIDQQSTTIVELPVHESPISDKPADINNPSNIEGSNHLLQEQKQELITKVYSFSAEQLRSCLIEIITNTDSDTLDVIARYVH